MSQTDRLWRWPYDHRYGMVHRLSRVPGGRTALAQLGILRDREVRRFVDVDECIARVPNVALLWRAASELRFCPPAFAASGMDLRQPAPGAEETRGPDQYAALFRSVAVMGGSNLVLFPELLALYDLWGAHQGSRFRFTDGALIGVSGRYGLLKDSGVGGTEKAAIHLGGNFSGNYYHFLVELLPRFQAIDRLDLDSTTPLLVDRAVMDTPQLREGLDTLNQRRRPVVAMEAGKRYRVDSLYYCSFPSMIAPSYVADAQILPEDTRLDVAALEYVRRILLHHASAQRSVTARPKRFFLSRKQASARRRFNEDDVVAALAPLGVESVSTENMSLADQAALFQGAELVIGGSGAAFANLMFCQPGCKAMILVKERFPVGLFSGIASAFGVDLRYYPEDATAHGTNARLHESFSVDPRRVAALVAEWACHGS